MRAFASKVAIAVALMVLGVVLCVRNAGAEVDRKGRPERLVTISTATSASASVIPAPATSGRKIVVKFLHLNASTSGTYIFTDGDGGTTLLTVYLTADTDTLLGDELLTDAMRCSNDTALYCDGPSSSTLRANFRVRDE